MGTGTAPEGEGYPPPPRSHTPSAMSQGSEAGTAASGEGDEEKRLRAALRHLQVEAGVLERLVYKHRNQHRGAAYFQYLLKVRRDLKLLLGAGLAEVLNAVFPVLACRKPANTILVPTKQTKKKPGANHSHHERLLGVARLLSQMSEPVMKAAIQITFLLARSFFVDLCTAVFSLLARMLLDVVSVYNKVTDLTDRKQAVKISISGVQAFREYYPSMNDACTVLECVWVKDKFILHEKVKDICQETQVEDQKCCGPESPIQYETLALISEDMKSLEGTNSPASQPDAALAEQSDKMIHCNDAGDTQSGRKLENESGACSVPDTLSTHEHLKPETRKRVAFVAVGNPKVTGADSETKSSEVNKKQRLDMISPSNIQSRLYNKLLDCDTRDNSIL
ncbi:uncharacterized protein LOC8058968 isoform X2 [Sorghum bicolor]|uniref:Nucleolus and neural progenitor protein-like N-terminal domain-containing protein n=1 Tax=Sorghum bicolor TaxID=4558 RepID=A0A1B6QDG9_SORBI|nr:uncharacterized protein LOC8058968 isoform X2 [Sorghum bicolor]KXG35965.1 hypothetical protein SORBI_3002G256500 [Sorghum bicolor]|eukprot:XP_021307993.1 uncharacterized protein LOC8058968 isoform X2 [Sorghum bicolor]